jgi:hypothetical protein
VHDLLATWDLFSFVLSLHSRHRPLSDAIGVTVSKARHPMPVSYPPDSATNHRGIGVD